jgi:membrane protein DedA with SNARE-associated domain
MPVETGPAIVVALTSDGVDDSPPTAEVRRRVATADVVCGTGLALGIIAGYVFIPLTPKLLAHHTELLEALRGSTTAIVSGGALARVGRASLLIVILAPLCTVLLYDVFYWWAGKRWGNQIIDFYAKNNPRTARWIRRAEQIVRRRGIWALVVSYYVPLPTVVIFLACGTSGVPLWLFIVGDVVGLLLWEALLVSLGWAVGHPAVHVIDEIGHYSTRITIALVVAIVVISIVRARLRLRRGAADQPGHSGSQ